VQEFHRNQFNFTGKTQERGKIPAFQTGPVSGRADPFGRTDLIVFCSGGFKNLGLRVKSEGELLAQLVELLEQSGAKYTILYASQPSGLLENPSSLPLSRHLAEKKINDTKAGQSKCDGECLVKSSLLEGAFVGIVLLIILISGLMCMMGIDTPSRFEVPQES